MIEKCLIPDVVIELEVNPTTASQRFVENYIVMWKQRLKQKQRKFIDEVVQRDEKREKQVKAYTLQALTKLMIESRFENIESNMEEEKPESQNTYYVIIDESPVYFSTNDEGEVEIKETISTSIIKELKNMTTVQEESDESYVRKGSNTDVEYENSSETSGNSQHSFSLQSVQSTHSSETKEEHGSEHTALYDSQSNEMTENLKFIPLESIIEWYGNQENKEGISIEISKTVDILFPVIELERKWETEEEIQEKMDAEIETWLEAEFELINVLRDKVKEYNIQWLQVDAEKSLEETVQHVTHLTNQYRYRSSCLFENTYEVTLKEAESLIKHGYYFMSKFGYWCPVQIYEKEIPVQMYLQGSQRGDIYPLIHRKYIYFISGKENMEKFIKEPLKYIKQDAYHPLFPARIAIIGPPKCGKSTLSHRLANYFGLKVITAGSALRYVLEDLGWCHLAQTISNILKEGLSVPDTLIVQALEAATMEPRCATQGVIFDGFPNTIEQCQQMAEKNMMPFLVIYLKCKPLDCIENWRGIQDTNFRNGFKYSENFMNCKISRWIYKNSIFKPWINEEYQNLVYLDTTKNRWWLFNAAKKEIFRIMKTIISYLMNVNKAAVPLQHLCITSEEFDARKDLHFNNYCPVCLKNDGVLTSSKIIQREGLIQYKKYYYWLCEDHYNVFLKKPEEYTPPVNKACLPAYLPESIKLDKEDLSKNHVAAGGFCVVTYLTKQPFGRLVQGSPLHAINYKGKLFLMCSSECQSKFMKSPNNYCDLEINWKVTDPLPPLQLNTLPAMGYLEQTVVPILIEALTLLAYIRPKCPTLNVSVSAAIFIGLFLKIHNSNLSLDIISSYETSYQRLLDTIKLIKSTLEFMSSRTNKYVSTNVEHTLPSLSMEKTHEEDRGSKISSEESSIHEIEKQTSESILSGDRIGPCGYEYPTGSGDHYMGDYYMQLPHWDSSSDSLQNVSKTELN
ncbi:hypothetical protein L9F63_007408 [Diploptera punctata]|uniref:Nucleoside-diphosphate kinase n=1 Tax=Diploptera punctata TaxID=6984 RepID=A0AAD7Z8X1_DIPPU|nr:hypothetical protein L9F63_007408 [Diploptera punctata]